MAIGSTAGDSFIVPPAGFGVRVGCWARDAGLAANEEAFGAALEGEEEGGAVIGFRFGPDAAAVAFDDAADGGEADASAFKIGVAMQALKGAKEVCSVLHVEPDAIIADEEGRSTGNKHLADFDHRGLAGARVFDGIAEEVGENLLDEAGVAHDGRQRGDTPFDLAVLGLGSEILKNGGDKRSQRDFLKIENVAANARKLEQIVNQAAHALDGAANAMDVFLSVGPELRTPGFEENPGKAIDVAKGSTKVVGHGIAEGFEFAVRGLEFGRALADALLELFVEAADLLVDAFAGDGVADGAGEDAAVDVEFGDVVLGAILDHFEGHCFVAETGEDDDGDRGSLGAGLVEGFLAFGIGKAEIEKNGVDAAGGETAESGGEALGNFNVEGLALCFGERFLNQTGVAGIVLDEENAVALAGYL